MNFFPDGFNPTLQQSKTIDNIQSAFEDHDYVILTAPTGSGKSFFSNTLSNSSSLPDDEKREQITDYTAFEVDHHGQYTCGKIYKPHGAITLTITKSLQDQYIKLFNCSTLKGKNNYTSTIEPTMDVEIESAVMPRSLLIKHRKEGLCPYHNDRRDLLINKSSITNYKMFMNLPDHVKYRDYIICDESSELEDELVSQCSCNIDYEQLKRNGLSIKPLTSEEPLAVYAWLDDLVQMLQEQRIFLQRELQKKSSWSKRNQFKYRFINHLLSQVTRCANNFYTCEYIVEKKFNHVLLTPLYVDSLAQNIFGFAKKRLLMSATIIDVPNYAKGLGIQNYKHIDVPSEFPAKKSPIYVSSKYPLNRKTIKKFLPEVVKNIKDIVTHHEGDKGIIHTHTHEITQFIYETVDSIKPRLITREPGVSNEELLAKHIESKNNTVLMSPSLTYGVDLKDDLSRFQIIVKLPYLPLHDKRIKKLFEIDPDWYENKMLNTLVQACGRSTRSSHDYSTTYILDGMITRVLLKCRNKLPEHFLQRFL